MKNSPFRPTSSIDTLRKRARLIKRVRDFFDTSGFFHVETPVLSHDTVVDRYLDPIPIPKSVVASNCELDEVMWLQSSPEFAMKRLLAAGADAIYQIAPVFRAEEIGTRHNPEFTMLEWYRVDDSMQDAMKFLGQFTTTILDRPHAELLTYREAFLMYADIDPFAASLDDFLALAINAEIKLDDPRREQFDRDGWLNLILGCVVEPQLGMVRPVIVYDWPASQSALAKIRREAPPVAERFELYVDGFELANGYCELLDPNELQQRNRQTNRLRVADGKTPLPENSRLLDAMRSGLPACSGVALGIDRLIMVALRAQAIEEVIAFPFSIS